MVLDKQLSFREIRYRDKRQKILIHAARIFAKKGYEKASLEEIAAKLKLSKAGLYHYFKSKDEVLFLIQKEAHEEILEAIQGVLNSQQDPAEKLETVVRHYIRIVTRKHVIGALRQHESILPPKWRDQIISIRDACDAGIQQIIQEGLQSGRFQAVDWKMSYQAAIGALNSIQKWYSPQGRLSVDAISNSMADFILNGFGAYRHNSSDNGGSIPGQ